jgi:hypothetical protein
MGDPPRLRLNPGSTEALLLGASRSVDPPPEAEAEVWRRLHAASAVGVAAGAAAMLAERTAAGGGSLVGKLLGAGAAKWIAVVAIAAPVAGVAAQQGMARARRMAARPVPVVAAAAPALPAIEGPAAAALPSPVPVAPALAEPPAAPEESPVRAARGAVAKPEAPGPLTKEGQWLASARAHLASGDARGALAEVARLRAQFPSGMLVQEREMVAIEALEALGETDAARARATSLLQRFPNSAYAARLRQTLGH